MPKQRITTAALSGPQRTRLVQRYLAATSDRSNVFTSGPCWFAPTALAAEEVRDAAVHCLAATLPGRSLLNPQIGTFDAHAQRLLLRAGTTVRLLTPLQRDELLRLAIEQVRSQTDLPYFGQVAHSDGVVRMVGQAIAQMKRRDLWAEQFAEQASGPRDRELASFYLAYQRLLVRHGLFDREGCFWAARAVLKERPELIGRPALAIVEGFTDFTAAQLEILAVFASRCNELVVALPFADQEPADPARAAMETRGRATTAALQAVMPGAVLEHDPTPADQPLFTGRVAERLYRNPSDIEPPAEEEPPGIAIIAAGNEQTEFETVCDCVKASLVDGNTSPEDILIVLRAGPDGWDRLRSTLHDFGLRPWLENRPTYATAPAARLAESLLTAAVEDWPAAAVEGVVCHSAVSITQEAPVEPHRFERLLRKLVFASGRESLLRSADRAVERTPEDSAAAAGLHWFAEVLQSWPSRASLAAWATVLDDTLNRLGALRDSAVADSWASLRRLLTSVAELRSLAVEKDAGLSAAELRELFRRCCSEETYGDAAGRAGSVRVVTPETARGLAAGDVYVLSFGEGNYPRGDAVGGIEEPDPALAVSDEMHLFLALASKPRGRLTLSYTALDDKAQPLSPSPYLAELRGCFPTHELTVEEVGLSGQQALPAAPRGRRLQRLHAAGAAMEGDPAPLAGLLASPEVGPTAHSLASAARTILDRAQAERFGPSEGLLESAAVRAKLAERYGPQHLWSASRLEQYAACPFRFFAGHVLRIEPPPSATPETDPARRGVLLHDLLAALLRQAANAPDAADWKPALEQLIAEAAERVGRYGVEAGLRAVETREISEWVPRIAGQAEAYQAMWQDLDGVPTPAALEVRFGPDRAGAEADNDDPRSTDEPFAFRAGEHTVLLSGKIDRVDLAQAGGQPALVVIDYKSGDARFDPALAESGRQLQLPLYTLAAEALLFTDLGARALAAGYWPLRNEGKGFADKRANLRLREADDEGLSEVDHWQQLQAVIAERVGEIVEGVRRGDFPVYNTDEKCTSWCDFRTVCRVGQVRSLNKCWPSEPADDDAESAGAPDADR